MTCHPSRTMHSPPFDLLEQSVANSIMINPFDRVMRCVVWVVCLLVSTVAQHIHNDPDMVQRFDSLVNGEQFRNQLMSLAEMDRGSMPRNSEELFSFFAGVVSNAHGGLATAEKDLDGKLQKHTEDVSKMSGPSIMMHKSGPLLELMTKPGQATSSSMRSSRKIMENLSGSDGMNADVVKQLSGSSGTLNSQTASLLIQNSAAGDSLDPTLRPYDSKGHISNNIKALAGVPHMQHVNFKDAYDLAVATMPHEDPAKERFHSRVVDKLDRLKASGADVTDGDADESGDGGSVKQDAKGPVGDQGIGGMNHMGNRPKEEIPFGARKFALGMENLQNMKVTDPAPGVALPGEMGPEIHAHEKVMRAVLGKKHSEVLELSRKKHQSLDTLNELDNFRKRLVESREDVMDGVFDKLNQRVQKWQDTGVEHLRDLRQKAADHQDEGHKRWKNVVFQHKLIKAQKLMHRDDL